MLLLKSLGKYTQQVTPKCCKWPYTGVYSQRSLVTKITSFNATTKKSTVTARAGACASAARQQSEIIAR